MQVKCAYTELVDLHKIQEHPKNPHIHSQEQIDRLAKLIDYQGIRHPILISKRSGFVVAGHGRISALKKLGVTKVPVDYQEFENEAQEYAFIVSDNSIGKDEWAALNVENIKLEIKGMDLEELDLENLGFHNFSLGINELLPTEKTKDKKDKKTLNECPQCGLEF